MARRFITTDFWLDPDIVDLSGPAKALLLYFITSPHTSQAGILKVHLRTIQFESGFEFSEQAQVELSPFVSYFPESKYFLVKKFVKWQCQNESFIKSAISALDDLPENVVDAWYEHNSALLQKYNITPRHRVATVSPSCPDPPPHHGDTVRPTVTVTVTDTVTKEEKIKEASAELSPSVVIPPEPVVIPDSQAGKQAKITVSERMLRECLQTNREKLLEMFPAIDLDMETEEMVAKYRKSPIGADPYLIVIRWLRKLKPPDSGPGPPGPPGQSRREVERQQILDHNRQACREFCNDS